MTGAAQRRAAPAHSMGPAPGHRRFLVNVVYQPNTMYKKGERVQNRQEVKDFGGRTGVVVRTGRQLGYAIVVVELDEGKEPQTFGLHELEKMPRP